MLTSRPTPSVENRVCSSRSFRFASSPRSKTWNWSARRPAACSPRRNRPPSLTSISKPAQRSAESRACRSWGIRGSRRMVEASVSAVLPQLAKDRRCSDFLALTDVWLLNRPCQTPRRKSLGAGSLVRRLPKRLSLRVRIRRETALGLGDPGFKGLRQQRLLPAVSVLRGVAAVVRRSRKYGEHLRRLAEWEDSLAHRSPKREADALGIHHSAPRRPR